MEIKTIEELGRIPVENDDFAAVSGQGEEDVILRPSLNYWQDAWRRLRKNPVAILAIVMLAALAVMCMVGPGMTGYDYDAVSLSEKNALPSSEHWFGTDKMGRDLFTRVWIGGRISMILGIAGAAIDMLIGVVYGGVAAYFGGKTDAIMMRIVEILASIPYLLLVVLVSLIVGKGVGSLLIAMCLTGWCHMARLVRGQVLQLKDQEYLLAAKALGTPWYKVIFRHLIPNTLGVVIVAVTFDVPSFIFGEAFLSYIGLRTGSHDQLGLPGLQCPADHGFLPVPAVFSGIFYRADHAELPASGRRSAGCAGSEAETVMIQGKKGEQNE